MTAWIPIGVASNFSESGLCPGSLPSGWASVLRLPFLLGQRQIRDSSGFVPPSAVTNDISNPSAALHLF